MKTCIASLLALSLSLAHASEEAAAKEGEAAAPAVSYIGLTPALVGNYGSGPKLKYYKADISLQVRSAEAKAKVEHHEPLIRNQLVMIFSQQTDESLANQEGKEKLRQEALRQVQDVLQQEEGAPLVDDLLFNNLVVQP